MSELLLKNGLVLQNGEFKPADVLVGNDGLIEAVTTDSQNQAQSNSNIPNQTIDLDGKYLSPGFFDLHFHGLRDKTCNGSQLSELANIEIASGVTTFTPTLCAAGKNLLALLSKKISEIGEIENGPRVPGFYLEGPFVALPGAIPTDCMMPADVGFGKELLAAANGMIRVIMISPELPGAIELIELMVEGGVTVALGHTAASIEQTNRAIDAGATLATHIYNVYNEMPKSDEGGVWPVASYDALVADDRVTCELICDGIHVKPTIAKNVSRVKGPSRLALITDSNIGAGLEPGRYEFPGWPAVNIRKGDAVRDADHDWLCGSSITVDEGVRRANKVMSCPTAQACVMASETIYNVTNLGDKFGKIANGYHADMVILDKNYRPLITLIDGKIVYRK